VAPYLCLSEIAIGMRAAFLKRSLCLSMHLYSVGDFHFCTSSTTLGFQCCLEAEIGFVAGLGLVGSLLVLCSS